ncbi:MAG: flagellin lysine-N-methylase [Acidobacteriota bacterium]|nr:flagellin lysine-N-methylase [Acidobacteriota bacterium]
MDEPLQALTYMTRFQCIGPECEDHCCGGWRIHLSRDDYQRLEENRKRSETVDRNFDVAVKKRETGDGNSKKYAYFEFHEQQKTCLFLDQGLCVIHRDLGEESLPQACATYPRLTRHHGDGHGLCGSLSCPEVARQCLLSADAMELVDWSWDKLPDRFDVDPEGLDPYGMYAHAVRNMFWTIYKQPDFNSGEKTYFALYLARKISSFYHKNMEKDPSTRLERTFEQVIDLGFRRRIITNFQGAGEPDDAALDILAMILLAAGNRQVRFNNLVGRVFAGYGRETPSMQHLAETTEPVLRGIYPDYRVRKRKLDQAFGERIEGYFLNFCRNFWFTERPNAFDRPLDMARQLILFLAVIKFLFYGHPDLIPLLTDEAPDDAEDILDRCVVESVQTFMRGYTHNSALKESLHKIMSEKGLDDLARLTAVLRF